MSCSHCKRFYGVLILADHIVEGKRIPVQFCSESCFGEFKAQHSKDTLTNVKIRKAKCIKLLRKCGYRETDGTCWSLTRFDLFECDPRHIKEYKPRKGRQRSRN